MKAVVLDRFGGPDELVVRDVSVPATRPDLIVTGYNGEPEREILQRLNRWISSGKLKVHIDQVFALEGAYQAHLALKNHYVGKLCFKVNG